MRPAVDALARAFLHPPPAMHLCGQLLRSFAMLQRVALVKRCVLAPPVSACYVETSDTADYRAVEHLP